MLCQACPQPMHLRSHDLPPDYFPHGHDLVEFLDDFVESVSEISFTVSLVLGASILVTSITEVS